MTLRLQLLNTRVDVEVEEGDLAALLARLWEPFVTAAPAEAHATFQVVHERGTLVVVEGESRIHHADPWTLADALRYRVLELVERRLTDHVTLHAAAVERDGRLALISGPSGAGKTTLTLALLKAGWTYLSDDVAPIEIATGLIAPFPKPLGVKDPAAWEAHAGAFAGLSIEAPDHAFLLPAAAFEVARAPATPHCVVFPTYAAGADVTVESLTSAKATALATAYVRRLDPEVVRVLNRLCTACDCYRLVYGATAGALTVVAGRLETPPPRVRRRDS